MQVRKSSFLKRCLSVLLMGAMAAGAMGVMAGTAKAAPLAPCSGPITASCTLPVLSVGGQISLTAGELSSSAKNPVVNNGSDITATGAPQTIPFAFETDITDARGSAPGWEVSASASAMTFSAGGGSTADLFLATPSPVVVTCLLYSSCTPSDVSTAVGSEDLVTSSVPLANALSGSGAGAYDITTHGTFAVPAAIGTIGGGVITVTVSNAPGVAITS